jgi:hypothetical protein
LNSKPLTQLGPHIAFEDLSDDLQIVAGACGMEIAIALMINCPGVQIYVSRPESSADVIRRYKLATFGERPLTDGEVKKLSIELGKSVGWIRKVLM